VQEALGELENLADPLLAHILAVLVLALEPLEAKRQVLRQVPDFMVGLLEALSCFRDGLGENVDITSGLIVRLGGTKDQIHGKRKVDERSTYHRLGHVGRW
jgi:hypothetical protein